MKFKTKKLIIFLTIITVIASILITGCTKKEEAVQEEEVAVEVMETAKGNIDDVAKLSGKIEAEDAVYVLSKISGRVSEVLFEVGDHVVEGQPLVILETNELQAQLAQAEAALAAARANLSANEAGVFPQQVEQVKSAFQQAEANYVNAKADYDRMKALFEADAISKQAFDAMTLKFSVAKTQYESAKEQLRLTEERVPRNIDALRAQVGQAEAAVDLIRTNIDNSVIKAPVSGIISTKMINPGEIAAAGNPLASVVNIDKVKVVIDVAEEEINKVKDGQEVNLSIDALGKEEKIKGVVSIVPPASSPTRLFQVKIDIENSDHRIKPGMFADVDIVTGTKENVIIAPKDAILIKKHGNIAYVVEDGKAVERLIKIGVTNGTQVEVVEGLKAGEKIVVKGQNLLKEGTPVKIQG